MNCKYGDKYCGTHWDCGKCEEDYNKRAWRRMTPEQKAYDNWVDHLGAYHTDYDDNGEADCCSCHISPPCNWCIENSEEVD